MSEAPFRIFPLAAQHQRASFDCGTPALDRYFREQVTQDMRRRVASCFIALTNDEQIAGFYTLASTSVCLSKLPAATVKKLPRYPSVPAVRMGRLAVDQGFVGIGLGGALLADAIVRTRNAEIAAFALMVDAKDAQALEFYKHHGFLALPDLPLTLFLPL
jgi:GNAT superfamily N-acetyltransferase